MAGDKESDLAVPIDIQSPPSEHDWWDEMEQASFERLKSANTEKIIEISKERDEALKERDDALQERDEARKQRDEARKQRDEALMERGEARKQRDHVHEALKQRNQVWKERNKALTQQRDNVVEMLEKVVKQRNDMLEQRDDVVKQRDEARKERDEARKQLEAPGKESTVSMLLQSQINRTNEIVEELVRQIELAKNEARDKMEHRNYEIAIEVSGLEATISDLRNEGVKLEQYWAEKYRNLDLWAGKKSALEKPMADEWAALEKKLSESNKLIGVQKEKLMSMESKMGSQRELLSEQLSYVTRMHQEISNVVKIVDPSRYSELSESLFITTETDAEENIRAALAGMKSIYELIRVVAGKTRDLVDERGDEMVSQLVKEKEPRRALLRSALSSRASVDLSPKTNELFNGLKDEVYALVGTLEKILNQPQVEINELKHSLEDLRPKLRVESSERKQQVEDQREEIKKEGVANSNVEKLRLDVSAAEETIKTWKLAAQQEADGRKAEADGRKAVEQNYTSLKSNLHRKKEYEMLIKNTREELKKIPMEDKHRVGWADFKAYENHFVRAAYYLQDTTTDFESRMKQFYDELRRVILMLHGIYRDAGSNLKAYMRHAVDNLCDASSNLVEEAIISRGDGENERDMVELTESFLVAVRALSIDPANNVTAFGEANKS